jgi:Protein tyrosine and serine/threonine kinase
MGRAVVRVVFLAAFLLSSLWEVQAQVTQAQYAVWKTVDLLPTCQLANTPRAGSSGGTDIDWAIGSPGNGLCRGGQGGSGKEAGSVSLNVNEKSSLLTFTCGDTLLPSVSQAGATISSGSVRLLLEVTRAATGSGTLVEDEISLATAVSSTKTSFTSDIIPIDVVSVANRTAEGGRWNGVAEPLRSAVFSLGVLSGNVAQGAAPNIYDLCGIRAHVRWLETAGSGGGTTTTGTPVSGQTTTAVGSTTTTTGVAASRTTESSAQESSAGNAASDSNGWLFAIIGAAAGLCCVVLVVAAAVALLRRNKKTRELPSTGDDDNESFNGQPISSHTTYAPISAESPQYTSLPAGSLSSGSAGSANISGKTSAYGTMPKLAQEVGTYGSIAAIKVALDLPESALQGRDRWTIGAKDLKWGAELGRGAYGIVYDGLWRKERCAIKVMTDVTPETRADFEKEAAVMRQLRPHRNVVQLLGVCDEPFCLVTEFVDRGALDAWLREQTVAPKVSLLQSICRGIACGVFHLHEEKIIHREYVLWIPFRLTIVFSLPGPLHHYC